MAPLLSFQVANSGYIIFQRQNQVFVKNTLFKHNHGDRNAGSFIGYIGLFIVPLFLKKSIIFDHTFAEKQ